MASGLRASGEEHVPDYRASEPAHAGEGGAPRACEKNLDTPDRLLYDAATNEGASAMSPERHEEARVLPGPKPFRKKRHREARFFSALAIPLASQRLDTFGSMPPIRDTASEPADS